MSGQPLYQPVTVYAQRQKGPPQKVCDMETVQGWWNFTQALPVVPGQTGPSWNAMSKGTIIIMQRGVEPVAGSSECAYKIEGNLVTEPENLILAFLGGTLQESCPGLSEHVMGLCITKSPARERASLWLDEEVDMSHPNMAPLKEFLGESATCTRNTP